jgi:hypothetical protein
MVVKHEQGRLKKGYKLILTAAQEIVTVSYIHDFGKPERKPSSFRIMALPTYISFPPSEHHSISNVLLLQNYQCSKPSYKRPVFQATDNTKDSILLVCHTV